MLPVNRSALCLLCGLTIAFAFGVSKRSDARVQYLKAFVPKYPAVASQAKQQKCNVCHFGKSKKNRNDYGQAVMKHVGKKNQKDKAKINEAFDKAAKEKTEAGKTFGELIKAGKLPGTAPK